MEPGVRQAVSPVSIRSSISAADIFWYSGRLLYGVESHPPVKKIKQNRSIRPEIPGFMGQVLKIIPHTGSQNQLIGFPANTGIREFPENRTKAYFILSPDSKIQSCF